MLGLWFGFCPHQGAPWLVQAWVWRVQPSLSCVHVMSCLPCCGPRNTQWIHSFGFKATYLLSIVGVILYYTTLYHASTCCLTPEPPCRRPACCVRACLCCLMLLTTITAGVSVCVYAMRLRRGVMYIYYTITAGVFVFASFSTSSPSAAWTWTNCLHATVRPCSLPAPFSCVCVFVCGAASARPGPPGH